MEWDAQRRADWFYHNRYNIERDAYERGVRDAEVSRRLDELERRNTIRDPDYVDEEFRENPSLMFDQSYVEAAYNPSIRRTVDGRTVMYILLGMIAVVGVCWGGHYLLFQKRWDI